MKRKIGIIGDGNVGSALRRGLERAGHDAKAVGRDAVGEAGRFGEILVLAVPFTAIDDALGRLGGALRGKTLVDVTNALTPDFQPALGFSTSGAEELQKKASGAKVVKAFNTVFARHMDSGTLGGERLSAFVASDDEGAKREVLEMARDIGFDAVDAGPLRSARMLESLGYLNITLGYTLKRGTDSGFIYRAAKAAVPAGA